jgi:hypothetical protein
VGRVEEPGLDLGDGGVCCEIGAVVFNVGHGGGGKVHGLGEGLESVVCASVSGS